MKDPKVIADGILAYLKKNKQLSLLPEIIKRLSTQSGEKKVFVQTAVKLTGREKNLLEKFVREKISKEAEVEYQISENLLGGILIKYGDLVLDLSLKGKIHQLTNHLFS